VSTSVPKIIYNIMKKLTTKEFIKRAKEIHGNKYDYSKVEYGNAKTKVCIICPEHGEFWQNPSSHYQNKRGCSLCSNNKKLTTKEFIKRAKEIHGNKYDYSKVEYENLHKKVCIICPEHGEFWQNPSKHIHRKHGCPNCGIINRGEKRRLNIKEFVKKSNKIHNNKYDYSKTKYINNKIDVCIICPEHGEFWQTPTNHFKGCGCPNCIKNFSIYEKEIVDFLKEHLAEIITNNKSIIYPYELDIYIPSHKIAIEFNGLYWHSEKQVKDKNYHLNKTKLCKEKDIRLIHIFEDEWINKKEIVKNRLKSFLGLNERKIGARKCIIKELSPKVKNEFLENYHIQGKDVSSISLGAFYNKELISVMTFCKPRIALGAKEKKDGVWELSRFVNKFGIKSQGIASKLLKYFERNYNPKEIYSYSDIRWNTGNLYLFMGMVEVTQTNPNYWYFKNQKRFHRFGFRKSILNKKLNNFDDNLTEYENMLNNGYDRIWDCGNKKFIKKAV
jgi:hypothetical protein